MHRSHRAATVHRRPVRSTDYARLRSIPRRTARPGEMAGIHTAHSTYYYY
ncbi:MAG TPA: hypothetical protein VN748_14830 [Pseudonocardiaceae bacterium]|nr:hypothetical protein [Pseudonocardiaceae bacterium]